MKLYRTGFYNRNFIEFIDNYIIQDNTFIE